MYDDACYWNNCLYKLVSNEYKFWKVSFLAIYKIVAAAGEGLPSSRQFLQSLELRENNLCINYKEFDDKIQLQSI